MRVSDGGCEGCSKVVRKSIARVNTVISQSTKTALRDAFKKKVTFIPGSLEDANIVLEPVATVLLLLEGLLS